MASSGKQFAYAEQYTNITVSFEWEVVLVSNNASHIKWTLSASSKEISDHSTLTDYSVVIDGKSFNGNINYKFSQTSPFAPAEEKVVATDTVIVPHDANGNKSFNYSFSLGVIIHSVGDAVIADNAASNVALNKISRTVELLTADDFTDQQNPTITYYNPSGNVIETLEACIANSTGTVIYVPYRNIDKVNTSYTFNLTIDERNALRAAAVQDILQVRFYIRYVYNGETKWIYLNRTMNIQITNPELSPVVYDTDSLITSLTGNNKRIILGYSDIYYDIGVSAPVGASIITQNIKCGNLTSTTNRGTFTNVSTNVIEFSATDSRGNVGNARVELEIIPYKKITCNQSIRLNADGTVSLVVSGNYFNESFGAQSNTIKIEARSRESGKSWTSWGDISVLLADASNGTYRLTGTISGFDPSGTYEFQARATDKITSAESKIDSVILLPIFDWGKYDFNFNVPLKIEGNNLDDFVIETGTEAMGTNGTWYWRKWKNGRAECYGCRNYGNMAITTDWGGWFRSGSFSQALPTGLFAATPEVIDMDLRQGSSGGWVVRYEYEAPTSNTTGSFIVVRPKSATISQAYISFNVIGRWK